MAVGQKLTAGIGASGGVADSGDGSSIFSRISDAFSRGGQNLSNTVSNMTPSQGMFAAGQIQDFFKRNQAGKLAEVQAATQHFAPMDLLAADQKGLGGFDPVAGFAESSAITKAQKERDRIFNLLEQAAGVSKKEDKTKALTKYV